MAPHGPRMVNDGRPAQATAVAGPRTRTRRGPRTHPSSYPHPHTHAPHRIRTAIDIDLRKSFQTEMISPPFHPRLFWSLVFSVRINQFRGIFTAKMRLVRLFPDACNGDVTHYTTFQSGRGAYSARSSAETRFARLRSGHKIPITI